MSSQIKRDLNLETDFEKGLIGLFFPSQNVKFWVRVNNPSAKNNFSTIDSGGAEENGTNKFDNGDQFLKLFR
jgi:hypothetical protein